MKYMMFVATDTEPDKSPEKPGDIEQWLADVDGHGKRITGDRLRPVAEAKTVRVRAGRILVSNGPFAESKEAIVGFDILECSSLDEAIDIASRHPMARSGRLELRPFWSIGD